MTIAQDRTPSGALSLPRIPALSHVSGPAWLNSFAMKFATGKTEETVGSRERLLELVNRSLQEQKKFLVGQDQRRCLRLAMYSDEGVVLELHRGKRWEGWVSPMVPTHDEVRSILVDYFETGDLSDDRLKGKPEWMEIAVFHPFVYIIGAILLAGAVIYFTFFKRGM